MAPFRALHSASGSSRSARSCSPLEASELCSNTATSYVVLGFLSGVRCCVVVGSYRFVSLFLVLALVAVSFVAGLAVSASAAGGTVLLNESFSGTSVTDPAWQPLNDACLTQAPTNGNAATLGKCASRTNAPAQLTTPGFLQLTDNTGNRRGGVVYNEAIPANGGLEIVFEQYQYGPTGQSTGADGIGFFLTDGATHLTSAGGAGGSLGYAQNTATNPREEGVNGGYLGVGLDTYGNFSTNGDGRGSGTLDGVKCANPGGTTLLKNTVALRGPGQGFNGYCLLKTSSAQTLRTTLKTTGTAPSTADPRATTGRTVKINISADATPTVTVSLGPIGGTLSTVLTQKMAQQAPASYKLGFSASTGGSKDTHLIRNVSVSSVNPLGSLNLVKQVDKSVSQPDNYKEGDTVPYSFVVTNTSTALLNQLAVTDPKISAVSCPVTSLPPMGSTTCTGSYTITATEAQEPSGGTLTNTATATAKNGAALVTSNQSAVTVPIAPAAPTLSLTKTGTLSGGNGDEVGDPGEKIAYSFKATNTGNVSLGSVSVTDPKFPSGILPATVSLAPGAVATFTAPSYTITQADIDAGLPVENTARASGRTGANVVVTSPTATAQTPIGYRPAITAEKTGALAPGATGKTGDTVNYSFTLTNSGNVPLTNVAVTDQLPGLSTISYGTWPGASGTLGRGQTVSATAHYVLKQSDVDAGKLTNSATATATPPTGTAVASAPSHSLPITRKPGISLTKTATPTSVLAAGEKITYTFKITNAGNTTLTGVKITDPHTGLSTISYGAWPGTAGTLIPGQSVNATATYTATATDVTNGLINNTATVAGTPPAGLATSTATATAVVSVRPDPKEDSIKVVQGETVTFNVLENDGPAATGAIFSRAQLAPTPKPIGTVSSPVPAAPSHGSVTCTNTGDCTYQSLAHYTGTDGFDYALKHQAQGWNQTWNVHVTVEVLPKNHAPEARENRAVATAGGPAVTIEPLANDTDPDTGDVLRLAATTPPADLHGTFDCDGNVCTYTPDSAWTGNITIAYTVTDDPNHVLGALSASGKIRIFVDPAPLLAQGFHDKTGHDQPASLTSWTATTTLGTPAPVCTANRPAVVLSWQDRPGTTTWILQRRLGGPSPGPWVTAAILDSGTTTFTDTRVGEGRSYQYRIRPDQYRWPGTFSPTTAAVTMAPATSSTGC